MDRLCRAEKRCHQVRNAGFAGKRLPRLHGVNASIVQDRVGREHRELQHEMRGGEDVSWRVGLSNLGA
jgi:hypothetical protein